MKRVWLHGGVLLDPEAEAPFPGNLLLEAGRILGRFPADAPAPENAEALDLAGLQVAPGYLDLHYHGRLVFTRPEGAERELVAAGRRLLRHGVTGFLPTTVAWPQALLMTQVSHWASVCDALYDAPGACPLGLHLEGPWISPDAAGAQPRGAIRAYRAAEGAEILDRGEGWIRMVTLAPEAEGVGALQAELQRRGIVASLGHTRAFGDVIKKSISAGASHVTHLFNAMSGLHHRRAGLAGVALEDDRLSFDLICDSVHISPEMVRLAARTRGEGMVLITDRVELPGPEDGADRSSGASRHEEAGPRQGRVKNDADHPAHDAPGLAGVQERDGAMYLPDGTLAGSALSMDLAVRNAVRFGEMSVLEAVRAATLRPARLLGMEGVRGTLRAGARADLVILEGDGYLCQTWLGGSPV